MTTQVKNRYDILDWLRGIAIILMVIFHFVYDLQNFKLISFNQKHFAWEQFNNLIIFLFIFCAGVSLYLAHHKGIRWSLVKKQSLKLGISAALISLGTYIAFPDRWIYFGTLHCILFSYLIGLAFINRPKLGLMLFIISTISLFYTYGTPIDFPRIHSMGSLDHIPLYPFGTTVFLGVYVGYKNLHKWQIPFSFGKETLVKLGKHSLLIYLVHQIILYPLVMGIAKVIN